MVKPLQLDLNLHEKQQEIRNLVLHSPHRFIICPIGRQWGKSYLGKAMVLEEAGVKGNKCMWVAPAQPTAEDHWNELLIWIENYPGIYINRTKKIIRFPNGGEIRIRSTVRPDNIRGAGLKLIIADEAAFFDRGEYVWDQVLTPMITASRGKILVLTTPNGRNWLYDKYLLGMKKSEPLYISVRYPSSSSPMQDLEMLDALRRTMPSRRYRVEYEAEFLADGGGVFAGVDRASLIDYTSVPEEGHTYVAGIDVGHNDDSTCVTILDKYTRKQVAGYRFTDLGTIQPLRRIIDLLEVWQPEITSVEVNGVGRHFFTLLKETLYHGLNTEDQIMNLLNDPDFEGGSLDEVVGGHRVRGVHMDNRLKREYVERLAADIEYGRFFILNQESDYGIKQINEMSTYERKRTSSSLNITYGAADDCHDDTVTALYLAYSLVPAHIRKEFDFTKKRDMTFSRSPLKTRRRKRL